jgi:hypothetical protein
VEEAAVGGAEEELGEDDVDNDVCMHVLRRLGGRVVWRSKIDTGHPIALMHAELKDPYQHEAAG